MPHFKKNIKRNNQRNNPRYNQKNNPRNNQRNNPRNNQSNNQWMFKKDDQGDDLKNNDQRNDQRNDQNNNQKTNQSDSSKENRTIYCSRIPLKTTQKEFKDAFAGLDAKKCVLFSKYSDEQGPREEIKDNDGFLSGKVEFTSVEATQRALNRPVIIRGQPITLKLAYRRRKMPEPFKQVRELPPEQKKETLEEIRRRIYLKKCRLIIHNLPRSANEEIVRQKFEPFGNVIEIVMPRRSFGRGPIKGYAIVGFDKMPSALKAIKGMNGKEINGNIVAVDFCLPKDTYLKLQKEQGQNKAKDEKDHDEEDESNLSGSEKDGSTVEDEDDDSQDEEEHDEDEDEDMEEEEDEGEDEEEDDESNDESDANLTEEDETKKRKSATQGPESVKKPRKQSDDVKDGRTLFIKNLHFDTEEEDLGEVMEEFGQLEYCVICRDKVTEHPIGTAFVRFRSKESADAALEASQDESDDRFVIDGRRINVTLALPKGQVESKGKDERLKDKRNLYLAKEGLIYPESPAAKGVSQADLAKRLQLEKRKRALLQNCLMAVSKTRLCVHNIPNTMKNDKEFLKMCRRAAIDYMQRHPQKFDPSIIKKRIQIQESRIMFDKKKDGSFGKPKGFGFVEFSEHEHALACLRGLNNNPTVFTPSMRPIVEFAIENKAKLKMKERRLEKARRTTGKEDDQKKGEAQRGKSNPLAEAEGRLVEETGKEDKEEAKPEENQPLSRKERRKLKFKERKQQQQESKADAADSDGQDESESGTSDHEVNYSGMTAEPLKPGQPVLPPRLAPRKLKEMATKLKERGKELKKQKKMQRVQKEMELDKQMKQRGKYQHAVETSVHMAKMKKSKDEDEDDADDEELRKEVSNELERLTAQYLGSKKKLWAGTVLEDEDEDDRAEAGKKRKGMSSRMPIKKKKWDQD